MLWWSEQFGRGPGYQKDVQYARDAGLRIENIHTPIPESGYFSSDHPEGKRIFQCYLQCVKDCFDYNIKTMVMHLPDDEYPLSDLGKERVSEIIGAAEKYNILIAFENLDNIQNLALVLDSFPSASVGFCYDSCHHMNYAPHDDLLQRYGNRLITLHLHDNGGRNHQHQLPFDGNIDWASVMHKITLTGYKGATTLEPMNWDYEDLSIQQFLDRAYQKAEKLDTMRKL